ncbi:MULTISPECIES: acyl carrier protein [unclassified Shewanella]|uniref:acyl carrier protein n=1 Tax=unclassified Shewanella TaxID=196818 RepID=UPI0039B395B3
MDNQKVLDIIADIIEVEDISTATVLNEELWDSLAVISFLSEINNNFDLVLEPETVSSVKSVQELLDLVK